MILGRRRRSSTQELPTTEQARPAGEFVASVLSHLRQVVDVGWNLLDVDAEARPTAADVVSGLVSAPASRDRADLSLNRPRW